MREDCDFSDGVRGKYAKQYAEGSTVVVLEPDVAGAFPAARAVRAARRKVLKESPSRTRRTVRGRNT
jgi:hypothetical protein